MAATVYVAGGALVALQLWFQGLPIESVSELPQTLLVTIILIKVVLPATVVPLTYLVVKLMLFALGKYEPLALYFLPNRGSEQLIPAAEMSWYAKRLAMLVMFAVAAVAVVLAWDWMEERTALGDEIVFWVLATAANILFIVGSWGAAVYFGLGRYTVGIRNPINVELALLLFVLLGAIPICFIWAATQPLPIVKVCPSNSAQSTVWLLLGESSDRVYVASTNSDRNKRYVSWIKVDGVESLLFGKAVGDAPCPPH